MKIESLVGHLSQVYSIISSWESPVDLQLQKYYRSKKYLGSKDRKFISSYLYSIIRNHRLITHIVEKHFNHLQSIDSFTKFFFINYILSDMVGELQLNVHNDNTNAGTKTEFDLDKIESLYKWQGDCPDIHRGKLYQGAAMTNIWAYLKEIFVNYGKLILTIKEELSLLSNNLLSKNNLCLKYSFPDWMVDKFAHIIPKQEMENFLASLNSNAPTSIRITDKAFEQNVKKDFEEASILLSKIPIAPDAFIVEKRINFNDIPSFKNGYFEVQDIGSQLVTLFVEPNNGMEAEIKILDACAGAGGKSLYLSKLIGEKGLIYAYDFSQERLDTFRKRLDSYTKSEYRNYKNIKFINSEEELKTLKNKIDILVLDAPCTGTGTIRRNPDLKWRLSEEQVLIYANKQLSILENYACYLKENGKLVYITCSLFKEENEDVINHFLEKHPEFKFCDKQSFCNKYNTRMENSFLRLYPHRDNTDGFTACCLCK
jgi:16S rRNA (cytosine967-C5)-methyltransferase